VVVGYNCREHDAYDICTKFAECSVSVVFDHTMKKIESRGNENSNLRIISLSSIFH